MVVVSDEVDYSSNYFACKIKSAELACLEDWSTELHQIFYFVLQNWEFVTGQIVQTDFMVRAYSQCLGGYKVEDGGEFLLVELAEGLIEIDVAHLFGILEEAGGCF